MITRQTVDTVTNRQPRFNIRKHMCEAKTRAN